MARKGRFWAEDVAAKWEQAMGPAREAMRAAIARPVFRRANTSDILNEAIQHPDAVPMGGRERLGQFARERYGEEAARYIYPYLGLSPDGREVVEDAPNPIY